MRILLDENVPKPLYEVLRIVVVGHTIDHAHLLPGWSGTKDIALCHQAAEEGFPAILTNDEKQMRRRPEVEAIAKSGIPRIQYPHDALGLQGPGFAIGTVCAGLPLALAEIKQAGSQWLI